MRFQIPYLFFFFSSRRRHTRSDRDWSSDVCSSDLDLDVAKIDRMWERIQESFKQTDKEENVETRCTPLDDVNPARTDPAVQTAIRDAAKSLALATMDLPSGAVQDAQQIAKIAPMGMIFVPSRDGISHSPKEF